MEAHAKPPVPTPAYWAEAKAALTKADPVLGRIIKTYQGEMLTGKGDPFFTLARSIVGQQISVKAADSMWKKFEAASAKKGLSPETVLRMRDPTLRACGLSGQKVVYMKDLARYFLEQQETITAWNALDDEALIASLTSIRGIGRWTAEMFMIFHLMRPDVLPVADIGLQKAVEKHYGHGERLSPAKLRAHAEPWRPYRSVATWYLWRSLDPVPVEY